MPSGGALAGSGRDRSLRGAVVGDSRSSFCYPRAVRTFGLTALSLVAACRFNFEAQVPPPSDPDMPDAAVDAPSDVPIDTPPPPPTVLGCTPQKFTVAATAAPIRGITAVGTRRGYDVFVVDEAGIVTGYAYRFGMDNKLEPVPGTGIALPVPAATGPVGALAVDPDAGDDVDVVIAVTYELPAVATTATGAVVVPLNAQLQRVDAPEMATMTDGVEGGPGTLAGGDHGTVAFAGRINDGTLGIAPVSRRGIVAPGAGRILDTSGHSITKPSLVRNAAGYLAAWSDNESAPENVVASILDENLVARPPVIIFRNPDHGSFSPASAYLASSDRYLFAWMEKSTRDVIKLTMRDGQLRDAPGLINLDVDGDVPVIAAGDRDFLIVWRDLAAGQGKRIAAARVAPDGSFMLQDITNTGGDAIGFDVVLHNGQNALAWIEQAPSGSIALWVDALCPPPAAR